MEFMTEDFCKKHLYPIVLTLLSSIGSVALVCAFFGLSSALLWFTLLFPLLLLPIHFLSVNGKPFLFFVLFPLLSALILFLFLRFNSMEEFLNRYTEWWTDNPAEQLPPYLFLLLLPTLLCISVLYLLQRNFVCRLVLTVLQFGLLITLRLLGHNTGKASVICFLGYILFLIFETAFRLSFRAGSSAQQQEHTDSDGYGNQTRSISKSPAYSSQLWPVVLITMLTLAVIPYGKSPIRWQAVYHVWNTVTAAANDVFQFIRVDLLNFSSDFSLKFSGYDNSGALGGEILTTYKDSLHVLSYRKNTDTVYLTGNTRNIYTGSSWKSDLIIPEELQGYSASYLDAAELSYAVLRAGSYRDHDNLYLKNRYEIQFLDYKSSTLFAAGKTTNIEIVYPGNTSFRSDPDAIRFDRQMKENTRYRTYFQEPNLGSDEFHALAVSSAYAYDNSIELPASDLNQFAAEYRELPRGEELDSLFLLRKNTIEANYLALPAQVPYRVYELAVSLTEHATNDYDKMLALEEYLRCFAYTTTPEKLPKDRDVTDYFLFDSQEGYCTYFATALAVLGRCVGIPTRYVQGYCTTSTESYSGWTLRSNNAHAWTEAYIDGLGWIPLDATPGYEERRYQPWHLEKKPEPTPSASDDRPTWWTDIQNDYEEEISEPEEPKNNPHLLLGLLLLLGSTLALLLLLLLYILYRKARLKHFLQTAQPEERFYYEASQIFLLTGLLCDNSKVNSLFSGFTLAEFTEHFVQQYTEVEKHAYHFCNDYSKIRYGAHSVTAEHCTFALQYKSKLMMLLQREKGRYALLLYNIRELFRFR